MIVKQQVMIRAGIQDWWLCQERNCKKPNRVPAAGGTLWCRVWLERWKRDWQKAAELRRMLLQIDRGRPVFNFSDEEVAHQIAQLVERGAIHIHAAASWVHTEETKSEGDSGKPPEPAAFPLSDRRSSGDSSSNASANDPSTFANSLEIGAQVAALMAASSQGAPFCPE